MFFKMKLFEDYSELCGVIGADGLPYFILLHVAAFLKYKNPHSAIHSPTLKQYERTVNDVISPYTTLDCINRKRRVVTFQEMINCMDRKRNFNDKHQFCILFKIGRLVEPIPDWRQPFDLLDTAAVLTLDHTQPLIQSTNDTMTVEKWLQKYAWNTIHSKERLGSSAIPRQLPSYAQFRKHPLPAPPIYIPENRPSDVDDPCVSSSVSPTLRTVRFNEDLTTDTFPGNDRSASQNNPLLQTLLNQPSFTTAFMPPPVPLMRNAVQNPELFTTLITTTATSTPTTACNNYSVQSPAPRTVPLPRYRPVPVNEEYLVEAPDSVRSYHQPAEKENMDHTSPASSTLSDDESHCSRCSLMHPCFAKNLTEEPAETIDSADCTPSKKRSAEDAEECEEFVDDDAFSMKQNCRKQTLPKRMTVNQNIVLPKIHIDIGEKTYALGISVCLQEQV